MVDKESHTVSDIIMYNTLNKKLTHRKYDEINDTLSAPKQVLLPDTVQINPSTYWRSYSKSWRFQAARKNNKEIVISVGDYDTNDIFIYNSIQNIDKKPLQIAKNIKFYEPFVIVDGNKTHLIGVEKHHIYNKANILIDCISTKDDLYDDIISVTIAKNKIILLDAGGILFEYHDDKKQWMKIPLDIKQFKPNWTSKIVATEDNHLIIFGGGNDKYDESQLANGKFTGGPFHTNILNIDMNTNRMIQVSTKLPKTIPHCFIYLYKIPTEIKKLICGGYSNQNYISKYSMDIPKYLITIIVQYYVNETIYLYHPDGEYRINCDKLFSVQG